METHWNLGRRIAAALLATVSFTLAATTGVALANDAYSHDSSTGATNVDWMAKVPDSKLLTELSLPGTHDSGASRAGGDVGLAQSMDLATQLNAGIRAWDIRLNNTNDLTIYHGISKQGQGFDSNVMAVADSFLAAHPTELVVMRIKCENKPCDGFAAAVKTVLDKYGRVTSPTSLTNLSVKSLRGKVLVLRDFTGSYGINFNDESKVSLQDNYDLDDNWDLAWKWWKAKQHLDAAQNAGDAKLYINYLSAANGGFPYFFASGKSSSGTGAPQLLTGMTRGGIDTCGGNWRCIDEFPSVGCFAGTCSVEFKGMNELATTEITRRNHPNRYGLIYADFPGKGLIKAVIDANFPPANVLQGMLSRRCVDVPGASQTSGTAVTLWDCHGGANQRFTADAQGRLHVYGDKCLEPRGGAPIQGTPVQIGDCDVNNESQRWEVRQTSAIVNLKDGGAMCLEPKGVGTANGTALILWPCNGTVNQQWLSQTRLLPI